jgi:uncharacterized membrane protein (DUF485 family)
LIVFYAYIFSEFWAIHTNGLAIQLEPDIIRQNPNPVIRFYGTLTFLCLLNTSVLTALYTVRARLVFAPSEDKVL